MHANRGKSDPAACPAPTCVLPHSKLNLTSCVCSPQITAHMNIVYSITIQDILHIDRSSNQTCRIVGSMKSNVSC